MPFIVLPSNVYLRRERHYVDSTDEVATQVLGDFEIASDLAKRVSYVQAVELADYNIPTNISPTFYAATTSHPGNNFIDMVITKNLYTGPVYPDNPAPGTEQARFSATIQFDTPGFYTDVTSLTDDLAAKVNALLQNNPDFANATFSAGIVTFGDFGQFSPIPVVSVLQTGLRFSSPDTFVYTGTVQFLFQSGINAANSAARVFGFEENLDTFVHAPGTTVPEAYKLVDSFYTPQGATAIQLQPLRYVDVRMQELQPSFSRTVPLARIYLPNSDYVSNRKTLAKGTRLLTTPLPYIDKVQIQLILEDDVTPNTKSSLGWDLTLDMLLVSPETCVPNWITTRLGL